MIEIYIIYLLIIVLIAIKFYTHFSSVQKLNDTCCYIYDQTISSPYYYYQYALDKHVFSSKLASLIGLKSNAPFSMLLTRLEVEYKQELNKLYKHYYNLLINSPSLNLFSNSDISLSPIIINVDWAGQNKYFKCYANIVGDLYAKPKGFILYFHDITEKTTHINELTNKKRKLQQELTALNTLLNAVPYPLWIRDNQLNINYFNSAYSKLLYTKMDETFTPLTLEVNEQTKSLAQDVMTSQHIQTINDYLTINDQKRLYKITEIPIDTKTGGFASDISDLKLLEDKITSYQLAQVDLIESSPNASAIYDEETKLKYFNQEFVKLWGFDIKWLYSSPTYNQVLENLREKRKLPEQCNFVNFKHNQLNLFKELLTIHTELLYLPDGKILQMTVVPYALGGLLFSYKDITERLELERIRNTFISVQQSMLNNLSEAAAIFCINNRLKIYNTIFAQCYGINIDNHQPSKPHIIDLLKILEDHFIAEDWIKFRNNITLKINHREKLSEFVKQVNGQDTNFKLTPLPDGTTLLACYNVPH